jgi:ArsR family transcriptional regulator
LSTKTQAIARVLSDSRRFEILQRIAGCGTLACSELRASLPITPATLSHHMKELESAGLIKTVRRGKYIDIEFCRDVWNDYIAELQRL